MAPREASALPSVFYDRDPVLVARDLLGLMLVRVTSDGLTSGIIVETEAYLSQADPANHAHRGRTRRNASMFGPPGHAYVYAIHNCWCLNAVTEPAGVPSAVLIRAVEPVAGVELMQIRRQGGSGRRPRRPDLRKPRDLARGPGRLCEAFAIDRSLDGYDLTLGRQLWIARPDTPRPSDAEIVSAPRIGVSSAADLPLRFYVADNAFVSKPVGSAGSSRPASRLSG